MICGLVSAASQLIQRTKDKTRASDAGWGAAILDTDFYLKNKIINSALQCILKHAKCYSDQ